MERLIEVVAHEDGGITVETEEICAMTGFRMRWIIYYPPESRMPKVRETRAS